jgi:hypothetical protein
MFLLPSSAKVLSSSIGNYISRVRPLQAPPSGLLRCSRLSWSKRARGLSPKRVTSVLVLKVPRGPEIENLPDLLPALLTHVLSIAFVGIYWNNHHHLLQSATERRWLSRDAFGEGRRAAPGAQAYRAPPP